MAPIFRSPPPTPQNTQPPEPPPFPPPGAPSPQPHQVASADSVNTEPITSPLPCRPAPVDPQTSSPLTYTVSTNNSFSEFEQLSAFEDANEDLSSTQDTTIFTCNSQSTKRNLPSSPSDTVHDSQNAAKKTKAPSGTHSQSSSPAVYSNPCSTDAIQQSASNPSCITSSVTDPSRLPSPTPLPPTPSPRSSSSSAAQGLQTQVSADFSTSPSVTHDVLALQDPPSVVVDSPEVTQSASATSAWEPPLLHNSGTNSGNLTPAEQTCYQPSVADMAQCRDLTHKRSKCYYRTSDPFWESLALSNLLFRSTRRPRMTSSLR